MRFLLQPRPSVGLGGRWARGAASTHPQAKHPRGRGLGALLWVTQPELQMRTAALSGRAVELQPRVFSLTWEQEDGHH